MEDDVQDTTVGIRGQVLRPGGKIGVVSQANMPTILLQNPAIPSSKKLPNSMGTLLSDANKIAAQNLQISNPDVWGVLTAISNNARRRRQGINVLLTADEHELGRVVEDTRFRIESTAVSAHHCTIYKRQLNHDGDCTTISKKCVLLRDSSTNGTFVNLEKISKSEGETEIKHGDVISLAYPPGNDRAFVFVYREVVSSSVEVDPPLKRKADDDYASENKRSKGIGIGAPEGPISLDDFKRLERSNTELRTQLESRVLEVDSLQNRMLAATKLHENILKEARESMAESYASQLEELQRRIKAKQDELNKAGLLFSEQKHGLDELDGRLAASLQSCAEANEIISSQKLFMCELKQQLVEERDQRKEERERASMDIKSAVQKVQLEAEEEVRRLSDAAARRESDQQEVISKLQELEREKCLLVETLRSKLEEGREKLVASENKARQLESHLLEANRSHSVERKRVEEVNEQVTILTTELEAEKAARAEVEAKVSLLHVQVNGSIRELDSERRRLKGARERIMLRETQLRSFYATTEEILALFGKQQEQLMAMQRTLLDDDEERRDPPASSSSPASTEENAATATTTQEVDDCVPVSDHGTERVLDTECDGDERRAICQMIGLIEPRLEDEYRSGGGSGSETEGGDDDDESAIAIGSTLGSESSDLPNQTAAHEDEDDDDADEGPTLDDSD